ncbi:tripartite tricarboxylate transporter permease [Erwiniaceae bacterium BAC15a-03b]|uniref:Tripartite tricarboxylate transporter permease n=1 Tax=Winslowiella arboricola TaxID=2978220 RepID=A0A9J6PRK5_9GAMM|nr:tripartite tricarboxylate transporter permease [Winslowiella arboricola]MCU5772489.1 tripartite tricarboxylate transporter permease [Winslowiella arboricola]MCU5779011.1 tripartite tricarboxylate transporter permease [Winslowiella arboricola]
MEFLSHLELGFAAAMSLTNLGYALLGCLLGTLIGVLPGLGPVATLAMLLPSTYALPPATGLIMLAGIYYGAQYGGSTTAILINLPGESSSVVTALDGHALTKRNQAGRALAVAAIGSFFAGCVGTLLLAAFSPQLVKVAFYFGPAEYFSLMCLGMIGSVALSSGDLLKALAMIIFGMTLGLVGSDVNTGVVRYSFGFLELEDGIDFTVVAMALFGFGEIIWNLQTRDQQAATPPPRVAKLRLSWQMLRESFPAMFRGSMLGSLLGILPGGGAVLASFAAYTFEKKMPLAEGEIPLGKGNLRGVAGPESANNAGAQTSFIPMLTLGLPATPTMALMIAALSIHDIQPGPQMLTTHGDLFWTLVASMWIGNLFLLVLNFPLINIWVKLLTIPYKWIFPAIVLFCTVGIYSIASSSFSVWLLAGFIFFGYAARRLGFEGAPLLLGFILGSQMEEYLRRALTLSGGQWDVLWQRPISATLLAGSLLLLCTICLGSVRRKRAEIFVEDAE